MYINALVTYNTTCKQQYSQNFVKFIVFASCMMLHAKITDRMRLQPLPRFICVCNCNDVSVLHDDIRRRFSILSIFFHRCGRVIFSYSSARCITRLQFFKESRRIPVSRTNKSLHPSSVLISVYENALYARIPYPFSFFLDR